MHENQQLTALTVKSAEICNKNIKMLKTIENQGNNSDYVPHLSAADVKLMCVVAAQTSMKVFVFPYASSVLRVSRRSFFSDKFHRYTLVLSPPPGPRLFLGPRGLPIPGLVITVISLDLSATCWHRLRHLPIVRLRAATRQLAAGDLAARAGAPDVRRRDRWRA